MSEFTDHLQSALAPSYTLERELTGGGMSRVFVATDNALGRKVVVKVLPPELAAGVNHERFRREIQVAAQLQHPHIVPLLSAGEQGSLIWYTMPFIDGQSLRERLATGGRLPVRDVLRILHEVAEALEYAHGLGVIHRDIKPGNVLMQGSHALVTDFGVSKAISAAMPTSGYTSAGMAIGTPAYMAPEQIAADPAADHRMDLYALGLLAYELLTGEVPFKEASPQQTMAAQLTREPAPLEQSRADIPMALRTLVSHLLQKIPADRPASAAEVVAALDAIPSGSGETPAMAMAAPSRGRVLAFATAGLLMVVAAWLVGQRQGEVAVTAQLRDSLAVAESLQAMAPAAALLTRDDSIAIARAVSQRIAESRPSVRPTSARSDTAALLAMADSIRREIQRTVLDSLMRPVVTAAVSAQAMAQSVEELRRAELASRSAPPPARGPRRVVVVPPRPSASRPDLNTAALFIADSLQRAFEAHPRYTTVPRDSVLGVLARSRTVDAVREQLDADVIVSISMVPLPNDSLTRLVQLRDVNLPGGGSSVRMLTRVLPQASPAQDIEALSRDAIRQLFDMERAARDARTFRIATPTSGTGTPPQAPRPPLP